MSIFKKIVVGAVLIFFIANVCTPPRITFAANDTSKYHLLAPLPEVPTDLDVRQKNAFSIYLNTMIRVFIGICAVLAVVMIVIAGIQWATSELISSKHDAQDRIKGALFGLLLALGSYVILLQINPDLLKLDINPGDVKLTVLVEEFEFEPAQNEDGPLQPSDSTGLNACPEGLTQTRNGKKMCKTIAGQFDNMIDAAKKDGVNIVASGFRSREFQADLRRKYCNGDLYNPRAKCSRTVAPVGSSRHENGLAFDVLRCNGKAPTRSDSCFNWMNNNGGRFGFYNKICQQTGDCVHWSIDGN